MVVLATFPSSPFFFPKLRIEQSFPFSCIGLVGMPLATPIFSWNHFDRKGMSMFWLNSIIESPCWLLWQLFFFQNARPPSTHFGCPSVFLESVCYLRSTVSCPLAARWSLWFHRIIQELPTVALQLYLQILSPEGNYLSQDTVFPIISTLLVLMP